MTPELLATRRAEIRALWSQLPLEVQIQYAVIYSTIETHLDRGAVEVAVGLIERVEIMPQYESVRAEILAKLSDE